MTDRELLERAAKAAESAGMPTIQTEAGPQILARSTNKGEIYRLWNPLTDDGDALRLAVRLGMFVSFWGFFKECTDGDGIKRCDLVKPEFPQAMARCPTGKTPYAELSPTAYATEAIGNDEMAAARRAIVRAAAAMAPEVAA